MPPFSEPVCQSGLDSSAAKELGKAQNAAVGQRSKRDRVLGRLNSFHKIGTWLRKEEGETSPPVPALRQPERQSSHHVQQGDQRETRPETQPVEQKVENPEPHKHELQEQQTQLQDQALNGSPAPVRRKSLLSRSLSHRRRVVPRLPRPQTFSRQVSERRERLQPVEPTSLERRAYSEDRRAASGKKPVKVSSLPVISVAAAKQDENFPIDYETSADAFKVSSRRTSGYTSDLKPDNKDESAGEQRPPPLASEGPLHEVDDETEEIDHELIRAEMDAKWILNISMHFRDKSDREKFFLTYAETPNFWRRITVSCDYRDAEHDSLEADLKNLHYQREKSARIYEAIRESLPEIQYYPTVTNLKLETDDGRLHVHVTEDVNEIIEYPSSSLTDHVECPRYVESEVEFESHLSGFVYKVVVQDRVLIKKEIPGPGTVDEFLYEIAALDSLRSAESVIHFEGLITDESGSHLKGLLISYAHKGALVDLLFERKTKGLLPWHRRAKWARQIVQGLSEIHEAGFVQGDFTLSNVVVDDRDDAKVIDINRRGCPVGWEPPEMERIIHSGNRIGMMIGVKTDIFQLGMVLWALGEQCDEPEREEKPLPRIEDPEVPQWYQELVDRCLDPTPQGRWSAREILHRFERHRREEHEPAPQQGLDDGEAAAQSVSTHRSDKEYIDPAAAVDLKDIEENRRRRGNTINSHFTSGQNTFADVAASTTHYDNDSSGSYIVPRGRSRQSERGRRPSSPFARPVSSVTTLSTASDKERQWEHVRADNDDQQDEGRNALQSRQPTNVNSESGTAPPWSTHWQTYTDSSWIEYSPVELPVHDIEPPALHEMTFTEDMSGPLPNHRPLSPPQHQDSGFDESLFEGLNLVGGALQANDAQDTAHYHVKDSHPVEPSYPGFDDSRTGQAPKDTSTLNESAFRPTAAFDESKLHHE